jgi:hypothetical protein
MTSSLNNTFVDLENSEVPFTYRFLGLRLRLAFTKRRFKRVEATFQQHLTGPAATEELLTMMENTFSTLREEIQRIEKGHEKMKKKALPKVREQVLLHKTFLCFLGGFIDFQERQTAMKDEQERREEENDTRPEEALTQRRPPDVKRDEGTEEENKTKDRQNAECCHLSMLNQGLETTTAIKRLIAEFAGVPIGMRIHDLRSLEALLEQNDEAFGPLSAELRHSGGS